MHTAPTIPHRRPTIFPGIGRAVRMLIYSSPESTALVTSTVVRACHFAASARQMDLHPCGRHTSLAFELDSGSGATRNRLRQISPVVSNSRCNTWALPSFSSPILVYSVPPLNTAFENLGWNTASRIFCQVLPLRPQGGKSTPLHPFWPPMKA